MKPITEHDWKLSGTGRMETATDFARLLSYEPDSGRLIWRKHMTPRARMGKEAGVVQMGRYRRIGIYGRYYMAHRIAWLLMTGEWPAAQIDHINGDCSDNRWLNLRSATDSQNKQNTAHANRSGLLGAGWSSTKGQYRAQIRTKGRRIFLGWFDSAEDAHAAYVEAARKYHGEYAKCA